MVNSKREMGLHFWRSVPLPMAALVRVSDADLNYETISIKMTKSWWADKQLMTGVARGEWLEGSVGQTGTESVRPGFE